ncbi:hypothetical protein [Nocardia sp. XZ_19_369]|uniref:hypothetical protein n=1 Tax=Nocardia sp. XZ_19_369 TaxID=2769487 RepID=UPI00188FFF79|nr:hypothetical protein [Nocardia sp. XZ_19_369]
MNGPLPGRDLILAACRRLPIITANPVVEAAVELAELHRFREFTPWPQLPEIDAERERLRRRIDLWVYVATPPPYLAARTHTQTVGAVVEQLAELTVQAHVALANAPAALRYDAEVQLEEMARAYQDFIDELVVGTRRVPSAAAVLRPP